MTALDEAQAARNELRLSDAWKMYGANPATHIARCDQHLAACINALTPPPTTTPTWEIVTAYARQRVPFMPTRTVTVASAAQLTSAIGNLRAGDLVKASAPFTVAEEFKITAAPPAQAMLDLTGVTFTGYSVNSQLPAVWLVGNVNLVVLLDQVTNPLGGAGVLSYGASNCIVRVNRIYNTGADAIGLLPAQGNIDSCDFYVADASQWGQNLANDPHSEKGTGLHGAQVSDAAGAVTNTRLAIYGHDGPTGACVQYGSSGGSTTGNRLLIKAERMTKASTSQKAGNALNLWGHDPISGAVEYLEATDCQGYAVSVDNEYHADFSKVTVKYGRATNCNLNPKWPAPAWQTGPTYQDVR